MISSSTVSSCQTWHSNIYRPICPGPKFRFWMPHHTVWILQVQYHFLRLVLIHLCAHLWVQKLSFTISRSSSSAYFLNTQTGETRRDGPSSEFWLLNKKAAFLPAVLSSPWFYNNIHNYWARLAWPLHPCGPVYPKSHANGAESVSLVKR